MNSFYDAWLDGDVELTQDEDGDDNTVKDSRNDGVKAKHDHVDRDEDDLK